MNEQTTTYECKLYNICRVGREFAYICDTVRRGNCPMVPIIKVKLCETDIDRKATLARFWEQYDAVCQTSLLVVDSTPEKIAELQRDGRKYNPNDFNYNPRLMFFCVLRGL